MPQKDKSLEQAIDSAARAETLQRAVRHAVRPQQSWLGAGVIAAAFTIAVPVATAAPFLPVFPLESLLPDGGGDGTRGFVLTGIGDSSGQSVSAAGDVNGDGIDDVIIGDNGADPGRDDEGESYVVFGRNSTQ